MSLYNTRFWRKKKVKKLLIYKSFNKLNQQNKYIIGGCFNMERKSRKNRRMSDGKKNIISALIEEYDIQSADDLQDALKDLLGGTIQEMLESEMIEHLGYDPYERSENINSRNGKKSKTIKSKYGESLIDVPQDREGTFEPKIVKKTSKRYFRD